MSNLIPLNKRTKDEQRKIACAGGKASGKIRAAKKQMRDILEYLMDKKTAEGTYREQVCLALVQKALTGDVRAFETIRDTLGENSQKDGFSENLSLPKIVIQPVQPAYPKIDIENINK
jgi:hypothetical protein